MAGLSELDLGLWVDGGTRIRHQMWLIGFLAFLWTDSGRSGVL